MRRRGQGAQRRRGGFTLVESLAGMSLFAIVAAGAGAMALQSMRHLVTNRHAAHAAMLAQEEMEYQRGLALADMASRSFGRTMGSQPYTVSTAVTPNSPAANMTRIQVTVSWTGPEGSKSYGVESIYTAPSA